MYAVFNKNGKLVGTWRRKKDAIAWIKYLSSQFFKGNAPYRVAKCKVVEIKK